MYAVETSTLNGEAVVSEELIVHFRISPDCVHGTAGNYSRLAPGGTITALFYKTLCECDKGYEGTLYLQVILVYSR